MLSIYSLRSRTHRIAFLTVSLGPLLTLAGCASSALPANIIPISGNWQFAASGSAVPSLSGELTGTNLNFTGTLHTDGKLACTSSTTPISVTGSADAQSNITLSGPLAGGTVTITGKLAANGKSLTGASYQVAGGVCAAALQAATAQAYAPIDGNYTGTFYDPYGQVIGITATLTQTPASDTSGNFQLNGSATLPNNPCFNSPVPVTNSQVTGGSFSFTYADSVTGNSVVSQGTFSADGKTLTVGSWQSSGPCGPDNGTGTLSRP